ncbi:MAG: 30S ribosomal protein S1 [Verrucomicrobia bacterium]|nr:30S ribosomal protein S1 [Verrucomicrobiota bacterium]MCG2681744.1 30S ribosomal protein S1 [Kiritimatiellia bacterium]MBU4247158.1 30S ribosomal protein S1 [Verrucomicrobiota bacterium]MBU4291062.1 30S ribosomal protein S1 [Verrucomicrobiota bacterium]MBU4429719.1 30S ribosomal protein S1 [Verrucomicrobiota bacterium]
MAKMYEETLKNFKEGSIVKGKVLEVRNNEVTVDIGYKAEGVIQAEEFRDLAQVKPGDEIEVTLEQIEDDDGNIILSKQKAEQQRMWDNVLSSSQEGSILEGEIMSRIKGGLIVDINGVKGFLPGSQVDISPVRNLDDFLGKRFEFKVMKINRDRRNIVLSRRELIEQRRRDKKKSLMAEIKIGQLRTGMVKNITDFGAFIDLGGLDGLLHITDMSWGRVSHPSKIVKVGDSVEVMILDVDFERERVSLGIKQKLPNPWDGIEQKHPVGSRVHGRVVNLVPYGAFVEIEEGVEGLVHVSEISWIQRVARASDVLAIGDEVDAVVLSLSRTDQKISLGIRQTTANPWDLVRERYPVGSRVKGTVRNFTSYGAFVELQEGIDGMIHVSDMSWTRKVNHPSEVLKKGDSVDVVVLEVDSANQRISLGLKQAQDDPWSTIASRYKVGQVVQGKVTKLASFGAFIRLEEGIDGLVHISQIGEQHVEKVRDVLNVGQDVTARVVKIDPIERRIGLSIKAASLPDEDFVVQEEMLAGLKPGEDLVDLAGAFDEAFGIAGGNGQEWRPGESKDKDDKAAPKDQSAPDAAPAKDGET